MQKNKLIHSLVIFIFIMAISAQPCFAISTALKDDLDYNTILRFLRFTALPVENFAGEEQKKKYEVLKETFREASAEYYSKKYETAFRKFNVVKEELALLMEEISQVYLKRTEALLDSTTKTAFDIIVKYSKHTDFYRNLKKPFDPVNSNKTYNEEKFHFFYDRGRIEIYLNYGYKKLSEARAIYNDPDFNYLKNKKIKSRRELNFILDKYSELISICRQAKNYGLEIYKIYNTNKTGEILIKYNIAGTSRIDPIFDDRIPEDYKIDSIDNEKLSFTAEKSRISGNAGPAKK